jgi:hypothetical protein
MADRTFMRANLVANTHVQLDFNLGGESRSNPQGTPLMVMIPVENAHALAARLLEVLSEYAGAHVLPPLPLGNGQQLVFGR